MKITSVKIRSLEGAFEWAGEFWEERTGMPTDIYPEFRSRGAEVMFPNYLMPLDDKCQRLVRNFLQIDTDEGVSGMAGPIVGRGPLFYLDTQLKTFLIGRDPMATELLWDQMYRNAVHGRKGDNMIAISYVDIALWDIKGKWLGQPVYRLLGGPVQDKIPAYASAGAYSLAPEKVKEQVKKFREEGYIGTKWFLRKGPADGPQGIRDNVAIVAAAREASGDDMLLMVDAWNSWDVPYTVKVDSLTAEYDVHWIEEPVMPDLIDSYAYLRAVCGAQIAGGEHAYTRWEARQLMERGAMDVYQFDPAWSGGISEVYKVCHMASAFDVKSVVHGSLIPATAQLAFCENSLLAPMMEYLPKMNETTQFFLKNPVKPVNGYFTPPTANGVSLDIDENKVTAEREISWTK